MAVGALIRRFAFSVLLTLAIVVSVTSLLTMFSYDTPHWAAWAAWLGVPEIEGLVLRGQLVLPALLLMFEIAVIAGIWFVVGKIATRSIVVWVPISLGLVAVLTARIMTPAFVYANYQDALYTERVFNAYQVLSADAAGVSYHSRETRERAYEVLRLRAEGEPGLASLLLADLDVQYARYTSAALQYRRTLLSPIAPVSVRCMAARALNEGVFNFGDVDQKLWQQYTRDHRAPDVGEDVCDGSAVANSGIFAERLVRRARQYPIKVVIQFALGLGDIPELESADHVQLM